MRRTKARRAAKSVSLDHHQRHCHICKHPARDQIERDFLEWQSPLAIAKAYGLHKGDPAGLFRHAHALGLFVRRQHNARNALERIIEQVGNVKPSASAIVAAVQAYVKINSEGQWVEAPERVYLRELFDRMTRDELETYAREGKLPGWFTQKISATAGLAPGAAAAAPADKPDHAS
jgi:hypothetical protein